MTLRELYKTEYNSMPPILGIYKPDEKGNIGPVFRASADKILEAYGDKEVVDHKYSTIHFCPIVELK